MTNKTRQDALVCVACITGAHGIEGVVKVKSFTRKKSNFAHLGTLCDIARKNFYDVEIISESKGLFLCYVDGVCDRTEAETLAGLELFVERNVFPDLEENEFYFQDLVGMLAKTPQGEELGLVKAVFNFGAGDILEIEGLEDYIAFTNQNVPEIDLDNNEMIVCVPETIGSRSDKD